MPLVSDVTYVYRYPDYQFVLCSFFSAYKQGLFAWLNETWSEYCLVSISRASCPIRSRSSLQDLHWCSCGRDSPLPFFWLCCVRLSHGLYLTSLAWCFPFSTFWRAGFDLVVEYFVFFVCGDWKFWWGLVWVDPCVLLESARHVQVLMFCHLFSSSLLVAFTPFCLNNKSSFP